MLLHDLVRGCIGRVNPNITGFVWKSKGFTLTKDARQVPSYDDPVEIELQVQTADGADLKQDNFVNMQGERKVLYANGQLYGQDRVRDLGGDLLEFYGRKWLVVKRLEAWEGSDWCKVLVIAQVDDIMDTSESIDDYDERG